MAIWISVFLVVFLVLLLIARHRPANKTREKPPPETGEFRGVEVAFSERDCCAWVKNLKGARLLPHQARLFPLPLPECDAANCRCRYLHFKDRRHDDDRRIPFSTLYGAFGRFTTDERRNGQERRKDYVSEEVRIISDADFGLRSGGSTGA
ncbi:MAG: hypothetical protein OET44_03270 [Gammaproteobacteria bacterium]|nr:hypothetical protein [Gammaproteobacteria bacterium]